MASRNTIVAHVEDRPGVLARVASLFRRRGFNIESLTVGHCEEPGLSRMTIVVDGDDRQVDQVCRQLFKLIEVISVLDITYDAMVDRELALIKVAATNFNRREVLDVVEVFRADVVDVHAESLIIQVLGDEGKVDAAVKNAGAVRRARNGAHRPRRDAARRGDVQTATRERLAAGRRRRPCDAGQTPRRRAALRQRLNHPDQSLNIPNQRLNSD